jgi:hypothetical protein
LKLEPVLKLGPASWLWAFRVRGFAVGHVER